LRDRWFFAFFVISGFCALLCQVVWLRLAMARFGVTAAMVAIVLSVFMAGLAVGNALGGRIVERFQARARIVLLLYAACEFVIALSARIVPAALTAGRARLAGADWGSAAYHLASGGWVTLSLLPFCVAMGATLPLALAAIGPRVRGGRSSVGHLYAANVLGAAVGTLTTALVLIELFGLRGTLEVGAGFNALLAALSLGLSLRASSESAAVAPAGSAHTTDATTLVALFGTGFASMAMEVVWVRQFTPLLGNLVYAFALILASYLLATLAGSLLYRRWSASLPQDGPPALVWIALVVGAMLPAVAADPRLPGIPRFQGLFVPAGASIAAVALSVAPLAGMLGFVTPWLVDRWSGGASREAGSAWALNGLGCIVGPLAGGFLLLPWIGERPALFLLSLVFAAIGVMRAPRASWKILTAAAGAAAIAALTRGEESRFPDARVRRDSTATVIVKGQGQDRALLVNGMSMTSITPITKFMCHLPLGFLRHTPQRGLVICFGMGTTFRSMRTWGIETTAVELVPSVPKFFADFHPDAPLVLSSPRAHVVIDDGRRFLDRTVEKYDVVVIDPPPPVEAAGTSLLYSREFYQSIRPHLVDGGIVQVWIPGGEPKVIAAFALALHDVLPYIRVFPSIEGWGDHLLASAQPISDRTGAEMAAVLPPAAREDLVEWGPRATPAEQLDAVLGAEKFPDWGALGRMASSLTDDRPLNEYFLVRRWRR
jgi:predicted membrane-bound spermidine synthase